MNPGDVVAGRYRVRGQIGQGGFSSVWEADDLREHRLCALKVLRQRTSTQHEKRLLREARVLLSLSHPNIVAVHDIVDDEAHGPVLVMELLRGESLRQRLLRDESLPLDVTARIARDIASALVAAHAVGAVHRDLKPENIFLVTEPAASESPLDFALANTLPEPSSRRPPPSVDAPPSSHANPALPLRPGSQRRPPATPATSAPILAVKVLDFGIVKLVALEGVGLAESSTLTRKNTALGTVGYMAPEQFWGNEDVDGRADLWALGSVIYECLTGGVPVAAATPNQFLFRLRQQGVAPIEHLAFGLPPELSAFIGKMLSFEREDRPASAQEVLDAFA